MNSKLDMTTQLAQHRTELAIERTHLAWVRTSFALITAAVAINRAIASDILNTDMLSDFWRFAGIYGGIVLAIVASLGLFVASIQAAQQRKTIRCFDDVTYHSPWPSFILAITIMIVGLIASVLMTLDALQIATAIKPQ